MYEQMTIFEQLYETYKIDKPIRLIEFFSGIGAQAKALEKLGVPFEHWKTCDWAVPSIHAYREIHKDSLSLLNEVGLAFYDYEKNIKCKFLFGVSTNYNEPMKMEALIKKDTKWINELHLHNLETNNLINIMNVHSDDLEIRDKDKYTYVVTYSFPCQDLSLAGSKKGMSVSQANGGTRSGLLWEVERILDECQCDNCLPQVLIMENVPEVIGKKNIKDFQKWRAKLESLGYSNYCEILNAKDYGIPQNRRRCFMVSVLGEYNFSFPHKMKLKSILYEFLEPEIDEKYLCNQKMVDYLTGVNQKESKYNRAEVFERNLDPNKKIAATITCRAGMRATDNYIPIRNNNSKGFEYAYIGDGIDISTRMHYHRGTVQHQSCQTITTMGGNNIGVLVLKRYKNYVTWQNKKGQFNTECNRASLITDLAPTLATVDLAKVAIEDNDQLFIKKLTPLECLKLMGFEEEDYKRLRQIGQTDIQIYHEAGDSIVVTVLMAIFGKLLGLNYEPIINNYIESLKGKLNENGRTRKSTR